MAATETVQCNRREYVVRSHWFWRRFQRGWEPDTFKIFQRCLSATSTYVDIGAWIGPTILFASSIGVEKIYAVEANPTSFEHLEANCGMNPALDASVELDNVCIYPQRKIVSFGHEDGGDYASSASSIFGHGYRVQGVPLSDYLDGKDPDFIKIDVEGTEPLIAGDLAALSQAEALRIHLSLHPPFFRDLRRDGDRILEACSRFRIRDRKMRELSLERLERLIFSTDPKPPWGTRFGNFFEILLETR